MTEVRTVFYKHGTVSRVPKGGRVVCQVMQISKIH